MNTNERLNDLIGRRLEVKLVNRTLTGILSKIYCGYNSQLGNLYRWVITTRNGFPFSFAGCEVREITVK